jgi:8-oxo-dGTP pyrophosphatase MutT (NUDIX family)
MDDRSKGERLAGRPWRVLESRYSFQDRWIGLRSETVELPNGNILAPYHTLEFPDWVCAVVLTAQGEIVLVEQYRHGIGHAMTELPAGAANAGEDPLIAMQRELAEETGYGSEDWRCLGTYAVNGARHTNRVHAYLALDARKTSAPRLEDGEILEIHEMPWQDFMGRLVRGELKFAACQLACLFWLQVLAGTSSDSRLVRLRFRGRQGTSGSLGDR